MTPKHKWTAPSIGFVLLVWAALCGGCTTGNEFRTVATPALHQGASQILNGLLDGLFAAIMPDGTSDGS